MTVADPIHVVFVHGLFSTPDTWDAFAALLEDDPDLRGRVVIHRPPYDSPKLRLRVDRRIADMNDLAERFDTYLSTELHGVEPLILVTHSQGGLLVQRYLTKKVRDGKALDLARIRCITMFACPSLGSAFLLWLRQFLMFWRHPQERQLRPLNREVTEIHSEVIHRVVNATERTATHYPVRIIACGGTSDGIVPAHLAAGMFPRENTKVVDGNHGSIIQPKHRGASSYLVLKQELSRLLPETESRPEAEKPRREDITGFPAHLRANALVGRDRLVTEVLTGSTAKAHVLGGLAGMGKSRTAVEVAYHAKLAGRRVWWVSMPRIESGMREVAEHLGAPQPQIDQAFHEGDAPDLVWRLLNACPDPWLVVIDNADEPAKLGNGGGAVRNGDGWLREPAGDNGMVIVTSQVRDPGIWGSWCHVHAVEPLAETDGASMLMNLAGPECGTREQARQLSRALGGLPLALQLAGEYIASVIREGNESGMGITGFESYRQTVLARFAPAMRPHDDNGQDRVIATLSEVFSVSLDRLAKRGLPSAPTLLRLVACLNTAPIPHIALWKANRLRSNVLFTGCGEIDWDATVRGLEGLGLIDIHTRPDTADEDLSTVVSLHPLLHGVLRETKEVRERYADYYGFAVEILTEVVADSDPDVPDKWAIWKILAPHAIEVCRTVLRESARINNEAIIVRVLELARLTSRYLIATGLLRPAADLVIPIVDDCASFGFDADDREILAMRHERGRIALESGEPQIAEAELERVVSKRREHLGLLDGEDHPDTLASRHKHARAILEQRRWREAEPLLREVVAAEQRTWGEEHSDTMVVRHSLARVILHLGGEAEAERMLREILEIRYRNWDPTTPETLFVVRSLAQSLVYQERAGEAVTLLEDALAGARDRADAPEYLALSTAHATILNGM